MQKYYFIFNRKSKVKQVGNYERRRTVLPFENIDDF